MEKVKAEAIPSSFAFPSGTVIRRIARTPDALKIYVSAGPGEPACLVTFDYPLGFRVVDERDLMEYWPVCSAPSGWLFQILSGGWLDQERKRPGSLMLDTYSDIKEYMVTGTEDCVSVFSSDDPVVTEYETVGVALEWADLQDQVIQQYITAYNGFDVSAMLKLLSPQVRFENWSGGHLTAEASGIHEFRQLAEQAKAMFSEREQRITSFKHGADSVVVSIAYRGRLAVDIPNGPREGTVLNLNGESEFFFDGHLISRIVDRS